jgi:hypothetical protein
MTALENEIWYWAEAADLAKEVELEEEGEESMDSRRVSMKTLVVCVLV